jgi:predicted Zn-dependent protease with MMP-like domain
MGAWETLAFRRHLSGTGRAYGNPGPSDKTGRDRALRAVASWGSLSASYALWGTFSREIFWVGEDRRVLDIPLAQFEDLVAEALDEVPDELARLVENVVFVVEDDSVDEPGSLLGLYEGIPLTERGSSYAGALPDRITVYRLPILAICDTIEDVVDEVHVTVVHEIAHHFGIDDDRLHDLGYG